MIKRIWTGHRVLAIALPAIAVVAILVGSLVLVAGASGTSQASATPAASATPTPVPTDSPTPTPYASPSPTINTGPTPLPAGMAYSDLDGVIAPSALAHRIPIAIMVDNQTTASRPQSGMSMASIVIQAPNDGTSDRYQMIFQEGTATDIGPIRSTRPYYVLWANEYKAVLGHFGGDLKVLTVTIPQNANNFYNMDGLHGGSCAFHRIKTRVIPHNVYTNTAVMLKCAAKKGYPTTYQGLPTRLFRDDTDPSLLPASQSILIAYRAENVGYQFDPATDSYIRSEDSKLEIDASNKKQVRARSIVVMYQEVGTHYFEPTRARRTVASVGSGPAIVFQEGKQIAATWKKADDTALTRFYDSTGAEIQFVRGEMFIQSIPSSYKVTVK